MIYAIYFVPKEGTHPSISVDLYKQLWPIMHRSVRNLGHRLVHITDMHTENLGDEVWRTDVNADETVKSRDIAWLRFVEQLPDGEQAYMLEPDSYLLREVPPLRDGCDMALLNRIGDCISGGFKLASNRAAPFYRAVVQAYDDIPKEKWAFHGDIDALHAAFALPHGESMQSTPRTAHGVSIEWRSYYTYMAKQPHVGSVALQFKGDSKHMMLDLYAKGFLR